MILKAQENVLEVEAEGQLAMIERGKPTDIEVQSEEETLKIEAGRVEVGHHLIEGEIEVVTTTSLVPATLVTTNNPGTLMTDLECGTMLHLRHMVRVGLVMIASVPVYTLIILGHQI